MSDNQTIVIVAKGTVVNRILLAVLFVFALGGCTTVGRLSQVVGGAYTSAGQVLIDKGQEDKRGEQEERDKQGAPVQTKESDENPAKKPVKKSKKG